MKILLIDDSEQLRQSLKDILYDISGVTEVIECARGNDALRYLQYYTPDIVILDMHLGDLMGFDVLKDFQSSVLSPEVIIFTCHPYPQYKERALEMGAHHFIDKASSDELIEIVLEAVGKNTLRVS